MLLDVTDSVRLDGQTNEPSDQTQTGTEGNEHHPEPQEEEDHFIEEVDRQDALDRVTLYVAKTTHIEIAHGNPGKPWGVAPISSCENSTEDIETVQMVVATNEAVEYENLRYDIGDVKNLAYKIGDDQIVAMTTTTNGAANTRHAASYTESTAVFDGLFAGQESVKKIKQIQFIGRGFLYSKPAIYFST